MTCTQVKKKKGTFECESKNIRLDAAIFFLPELDDIFTVNEQLNAFLLSPWVRKEFRRKLRCAAVASDVWLMSLLASIAGLELR